MSDQIRKEDLRRGVRRFCAERPGTALPAVSARRSLSREFETLTEAEVKDALTFMVGLGQIEEIKDPLGSSVYYRITAQGTLAHERGE